MILGRQQLFTESTLSSILPLLTRRDGKTLYCVARLWLAVLFFNIVGTFFFAWLVSHAGLFDAEVNKALRTVAEEAMKDSFVPTMVKAILAGWLIALIVWLMPGAGQSRLLLILILTYVVAIAHFSHIIAGSVEASFNVFVGHISLGEYFTRFMIPTLIGNTIGGAFDSTPTSFTLTFNSTGASAFSSSATLSVTPPAARPTTIFTGWFG